MEREGNSLRIVPTAFSARETERRGRARGLVARARSPPPRRIRGEARCARQVHRFSASHDAPRFHENVRGYDGTRARARGRKRFPDSRPTAHITAPYTTVQRRVFIARCANPVRTVVYGRVARIVVALIAGLSSTPRDATG